jgi:hypothetical protein
MAEDLSFDKTYFYKTLKSGITVPVTLRLNQIEIEFIDYEGKLFLSEYNNQS